jgi:hypothetical protein
MQDKQYIIEDGKSMGSARFNLRPERNFLTIQHEALIFTVFAEIFLLER